LEKELVNLQTTNHTYFRREFEHFEFFKSVVLPQLKQREQNTKDLRIWCGAASTGEEPYMIAMTLKDFFGLDASAWDTKVLATDISTKVLQQAIAGIYTEEKLKDIPDQWKRHFFKKTLEGNFQVKEELKREVIFRQFNLMSPFPFKRRMHTIFLRNVMIYFDENTKNELLRKVYDFLEPGGYLFIGMTETLDRTQVPFEMVRPSIFRRV
ncbi:MAG: protein-glutamate O-methyltransferase CheR, partial [Acetatifactor sp.]|nr:protein-glutamate O-methyltransferase CheR [Acetatifactor sp.]